MKVVTWLYLLSDIIILQFVINVSECYATHLHSYNSAKNIRHFKFQNVYGENNNLVHSLNAENPGPYQNEEERRLGGRKDSIVKERVQASYFFPIFPQFHDVDHNGVINWIKDTDTIIFFISVHILETFFVIVLWILINSFVWDGEIKRDEDLFFPFNILANMLKGEEIATLNIKENGLSKDKKETLSINNANVKSEKVLEKTGIRNHPLAEISLNNLFNLLVSPGSAAVSLTFSFFLDTIIMVLWLLPTFLWTGQDLDENDRPFQSLETFSINFLNNRRKYGEKLPKKAGETESRFIKLYNALLCPQCIARQAVIQGVVLVGKLIFVSIMGILPREDFDTYKFNIKIQ